MLVKALSVQQPWAWAIVSGHYLTEQRFYNISYRGELYIHASTNRWRVDAGHKVGDLIRGVESPREYVYGAIIGKVELVDCLTVSAFRKSHAAKYSYGSLVNGPFVLVMRNPVEVPPIYVRGALKIFECEVPDGISEAPLLW